MALANDLCTVDYALTELGLPKDGIDAVGRARLLKLIKGISQAIRNYTGVPFAAAQYVETFDGGGPSFNLMHKPAAAIIEVADLWTSPATVLDRADYAVDLPAGLVFQKAAQIASDRFARQILWEGGRQRWRVTYQAGSDTIPDDIQLACVRWVSGLRAVTPGMQSERIGDYSYATSNDAALALMPADVRQILDSGYRSRRIRIA